MGDFRGQGRKPKAATIRERDRLAVAVPSLTRAPAPPGHLSKEAKEIWRRLAHQLVEAGVLTTLDLTALELIATTYAGWLQAERTLQAEGAMVVNGTGTLQVSPWVGIGQQYERLLFRLLGEFGLTPASRYRVPRDRKAASPRPATPEPSADPRAFFGELYNLQN